jgi:hypothetical protein
LYVETWETEFAVSNNERIKQPAYHPFQKICIVLIL